MSTQQKTHPPFRAEHVGSLLRPRELVAAFRDRAAGKLSPDTYQALQDKCVREVVRLQEEIGLQGVTDGEYRRGSYWSHFVDALEGMAVKESLFAFQDESGQQTAFTAPHVTGKLRRKRGISRDEFQFLQSVTKHTPKLTMPSPPTMHFWRVGKGVEPSAYPNEDAFFDDLAGIYRQELAELAGLGATYVQIDEVPLAMLCDPHIRDMVKGNGEDPLRLIRKYIDLINASLSGRPEQLTVGMHLCRGNYKARWISEGAYDFIAEQLFNEVNVDAYFLEYDTPRAGGFQPLRFVPPGKTMILSLVSTKTPELESVDGLKRRIDEASRSVALDQIGISPQCGFASTVAGNPVQLEQEIAKLRLVVDVARQVWGA